MPDGEDERGDQQSGPERRAEDVDPLGEGLVDARLEVAAVEGLLRERDEEELAERVVRDRHGAEVDGERVLRVPPGSPAEVVRNEDHGRASRRPRESARAPSPRKSVGTESGW